MAHGRKKQIKNWPNASPIQKDDSQRVQSLFGTGMGVGVSYWADFSGKKDQKGGCGWFI